MTGRILFLRRLFFLGLAALILRLAFLQLLHGAAFRQLAERNRLRLIPEAAPRGLILDREGRRLAANRITFRVSAIPQDLPSATRSSGSPDRALVFAHLSRFVEVTPKDLEKRFQHQRTLPFVPAALITHVPKTTALRVEEERLRLPGIVVEAVVHRHYPLGPTAAHLLGYLSQPTAEALPALKPYGVTPKDLVGRTGLEGEFETVLRGQSGGAMIEVDHRARQTRVVGARQPQPGEPLTLTLDAQLQALVEERFGQQAGAAVVLNPKTGEVLAMVSVPVFEPEAFALQDQAAVRRYLSDPRAPLMNRATHGTYVPGSIVKPITAMAALHHRLITPQSTTTCAGRLVIGDRAFHCWKRDGHGPLTLHEALMRSCNVYFMETGRRLGVDRLRQAFERVGLGRPTGWWRDEEAGHLPTRQRFTEGETALLAMGQGEILATPLQVAVLASAIANDGLLVTPWVVKAVGERPVGRPHVVPIGWAPEPLAAVRAGMLAVVNGPQGTGLKARSGRIRIAGKTGTAQTHVPGRPHGWFMGFCPFEDPVVAMAIVAEHGGSGGELPALIGKAVCEWVAGPGEHL